ncbi:MAG: HAD-IIB family hydrolase [Planctomycetota bacterium]
MVTTKMEPAFWWLFTDLDGTLIPHETCRSENSADLMQLSELLSHENGGLVFVTGRHLRSALEAKEQFQLPTPSYIICDVGTTIAERSNGKWQVSSAYRDYLADQTTGWSSNQLFERLKLGPETYFQEKEKQGQFKISLYTPARTLNTTVCELQDQIEKLEAPYSTVASVDPFTGDGLIDFLPRDVDKGSAARWLAAELEIPFTESVIFSGDSGNDTAAITSGCKAILVANADRQLATSVAQTMQNAGVRDKLFLATRPATSGVLEGLKHFLR